MNFWDKAIAFWEKSLALWDKVLAFWEKYEPSIGWIPECLFIFIATVIISSIAKGFISSLRQKARIEKNIVLNTTYHAISAPAIVAIYFIGFIFIFLVLRRHFDEPAILSWIEPVERVGAITIATWVVYRFLTRGEANLVNPPDNRKPVNRTTALAIARLLKIGLFTMAFLLIIQSLGLEIGGIITLGSAGTIVLGIAAKDLLANFFGGLMIFTDRPFSVGDWIRSPEKNIEGDVEYIGWRLTRIRTFDKRPLYVPNSLFLTLTIENPQRMLNRRIKEVVGVRYQDVSKIPAIVEEIESMLKAHPGIDTTKTLFVAFNHFGASSLDLLVYCFTKTTEWIKYMKVQQEVFLRISDIVRAHDADIAYPTTTLDFPDDFASKEQSLVKDIQPT